MAPDAAVVQLCPQCGLCCSGVLFKDVEIQPGEEVEKLKALGLQVSVPRSNLRFATAHRAAGRLPHFSQPCVALDDCLCCIYPDRPARCREFECALLKAVVAGKTEPDVALRVIRTTRQRADGVRKLLRELGDTDERIALSLRFKRMKKHFERALLNDDLAETFGKLTLAVHDLNLILHNSFYTGCSE